VGRVGDMSVDAVLKYSELGQEEKDMLPVFSLSVFGTWAGKSITIGLLDAD